jgi:RNA polymerase sigma factor (sigma-70 family)
VARHGALVWRVSRGVLRQTEDAQDVFQATFLILARKAASLRRHASIAGWLHQTAQRLALKTRTAAARRLYREHQVPQSPSADPLDDITVREARTILDEELGRLSAAYREPVLLCLYEGATQDEAARRLGCSLKTLQRRLERGRELLRQRLSRRGLLPVSALAVTLYSHSQAPAHLVRQTITAATQFVAGQAMPGSAAVLAEGILRTAAFKKMAGYVAFLVAAGGIMLAGGLAIVHAQLATNKDLNRTGMVGPQAPVAASVGPEEGAKSGSQDGKQQDRAEKNKARTDLHGDPLPQGPIARFGTTRQRAPASRLAISADAKEIIAVTEDLTVRRFDALTGQLRTTQRLSKTQSNWTWISPRGTYVIALKSGQLELWDLPRGKPVRTLSLGKQGRPLFRGVEFSSDERVVAVSAFDNLNGQIILWDLETFQSAVLWSQKRKNPRGPAAPVALALSPDGKRLAAILPDNTLRCWEAQGGKLLWQLPTMDQAELLFSPNGETVVSASEREGVGIRRWDARTGKPIETKNQPPKDAVQLIGFVGTRLAFETALEEAILWDPDSAEVTLRLPPPHSSPGGRKPFLRGNYTYAFTPDGKGLVRRAGTVQRWDLITGKPAYADTEDWGHTEAILRVLFSPDGKLLASSSVDQTVRVWNVATAGSLRVIPKDRTHHVAFSLDGRYLFIRPPGSDDVVLREWDLTTGRAKQDYKLPDHPGPHPITYIKELQVTSDGTKILMTNARWENGYKTWLTTWDALSAKCIDHRQVPWDLGSVLTADGNGVVALDARTGALSFLEIVTGKPRWQLATRGNLSGREVDCDLTLSPSGRLVAARASFLNSSATSIIDDDTRIMDVSTGRQIVKLPIPRAVANQKTAGDCFAFTADDRLFAAITAEGVRLWETASWQEIGYLKDMSGTVGRFFCMAFSPDGRTLATGHADSTILLWDATLRGGDQTGTLTAADVEAHWTLLAEDNATSAYAAFWHLVDDPRLSVKFINDRLKPILALPPDATRPLLSDLDSAEFQKREAAKQKLEELGELAEPALRLALKANPSLEMRKRLETLLERLTPTGPLKGEALRDVRAIQILERIGTPQARSVLQRVSQGLESASLTRAAKESLSRMIKR